MNLGYSQAKFIYKPLPRKQRLLRCQFCGRPVSRQAARVDSGYACKKCIAEARNAQA